MKRLSRIAFVPFAASLALATTLATVGTAGVAFAAPDASAVHAAEHGARHGKRTAHGGQHHGAAGALVFEALRLPSLRADQRQKIEQIVAEERAAKGNVRAARAGLMRAVADQVQAGRVDSAALQPKVQEVARAEAADVPVDRAAIEKVHAVLDPQQRAELVQKIEGHAQAARAREEGREREDGGARPEHAHEGMLGGLAKGLDLTPQQRQQIRDAIKAERQADGAPREPHDRAAKRVEHAKVLDAFKSDRFVMNELVPPPTEAQLARGTERMIDLAKATTPVLTPAQRAKLAETLRARAAHASQPTQAR